jgi:hypothetical protein
MKSTPHRANFGAAWQNELLRQCKCDARLQVLRLEMAVAPDKNSQYRMAAA